MGVFGSVTFNKKKSERNLEKMKFFFEDESEDNKDFELVYGFYHGSGDSNFGYKGMVVAFRESDSTLTVIDTDSNFEENYGVHTYHPGDFKKVKRNNSGQYLFFMEKDLFTPTECLEIRDIYEDEQIFPYLEQREKLRLFDDFFDNFKKKVK
ncbi:MAG: hypothetical protein IJ608_06520 [Lachnospiraceae bacterium]|nr:hypothetical protein [Lachnospiraceae bacterium]